MEESIFTQDQEQLTKDSWDIIKFMLNKEKKKNG